MPRPAKGESRSHFVSRAIPMLISEGCNQDQAVGKAEGMFTYYSKHRAHLPALHRLKKK